jgi:hypothetical protein
MRSIPVPPLVLAALSLASTPLAAQDLGMVEGLFEEVSAVAVSYQMGGVPASDEVTNDGMLNGAGTEVLINLHTSGTTEFELGLGASYLQGYQAAEPSLDLRTSLRALPTVSLYVSRPLTGALDGFLGGSFGLVELWNGQAYDESGNAWDVEARTFEVGASAGAYLGLDGLPGVFAEGGWRVRRFPSVEWTPQGEEALPSEWPRSLDLSGWFVSLGLQLRLDEDGAEDEKDAITPPAPAGVWMLERVDGAPLPAPVDSVRSVQHEVVHAVLRLRRDEDARADGAAGAWTLEMNLRPVPGRSGTRTLHQESGTYTVDENVLTLTGQDGRRRRMERLAGRLYLQWSGHVLVFAPGNADAADDES